MGLRINTNISTLTALRTLNQNDRAQVRSLERLATGLRINRASDDPSGLVISEQLRAQIGALNKAVENTENASSLLAVADSALQEITDLLSGIQRSLTFAMNTGGSSPEQILAEQAGVDNAIAAIDRVAATTRYSDRALINGVSAFNLPTNTPDLLNDLKVRSVGFALGELQRSITISAVTNPFRGQVMISGVGGITASTRLRISGPRGTEDIILASGIGATGLAQAINSVAGYTGIFASGTAAGRIDMFTEEFGSAQLVRIEGLAGQVSSTGGAFFRNDTGGFTAFASPGVSAGTILSDRGLDAQVTFEAQLFTGIGRFFAINTRSVTMEFSLDPDFYVAAPTGPASAVTFDVGNTGLAFQLNEFPLLTDRIHVGFEAMQSSFLGFDAYRDRVDEVTAGVSTGAVGGSWVLRGGYLKSIQTGQANDLFQNAGNASHIVRGAIKQVATFRGYLGAVQGYNLEPNRRQLDIAIENLSAGLSKIRDLDFAEETSNFVKRQILFQSGIAVLANANTVPQSVLALITG